MKIKIVKPIRVTGIGKDVLPKDFETEVSKAVGEVLIDKGYAEETGRLNAGETIELVNAITEIADLDQFESDERATVKKAVKAKRLELNTGE